MDFARQSLALGGGSTAEGMGSTQGTPRGQIAGGPPAPPQCPTTGQGTEPTLDRSMWSYPGACDFKLRGKKYLRDRKKVLGFTSSSFTASFFRSRQAHHELS